MPSANFCFSDIYSGKKEGAVEHLDLKSVKRLFNIHIWWNKYLQIYKTEEVENPT